MIMQETSSTTDSDSEIQVRRVAIQGYSGAFHEIAAHLFFKEEGIAIAPANTFNEVVEMVEKGEADTALMAIENTLAGSIMPNFNLLNDSKLKIVGEVYLRIKQNLMVLPGQKVEDLKEVHSHYMAIAQCRGFFMNYPHIHLVETTDTALSAKIVRDENLQDVGAIASTLAADLYGLEIIGSSIETNKLNYTRFLVLRREETVEEIESANKVSLCFSIEHEVGSLHKVLALMSAYDLNLTKIQSTPIIGKQWEYMFFVDFVIKG
ncbi:MAG: prephenate dehydratase, partial [Saprospiraceae bacterium]|nr:prephenate dehydratase [Saprospiraceae bacterium]